MRPRFIAGLIALAFSATLVNAQLPSLIDLTDTPGTEGTPVTRLYGDTLNERFGVDYPGTVTFADLNHDGLDDLAVGADFASPTGTIYVQFGDAGLPAISEIDYDTDTAISGNGETRITTHTGLFGNSLARGDFNGDGIDDLLSGNPGYLSPGITSGAPVIIYGTESFPEGQRMDLGNAMAISSREETRIYADDNFDVLGSNVAAGDIDADGYDDAILWSLGGPFPSIREIFIIYGGPTLPNRIINLDTDGAISAAGETRIVGASLDDEFGVPATGDFNGDGFADILLGSSGASPEGRDSAGEAYIVWGDPALRAQVITLETDGPISGLGETRILGDDSHDFFGGHTAAGDVDGDGFDDAIVTAYNASAGATDRGGLVCVIYGGPSLPGQIINLDSDDAISGAGETRIYGPADAPAWLGYQVAAGDVDGDGFADIIAGARATDPGGLVNAGSVHLIHGGSGLPGSLIDLSVVSAEVTVLGAYAGDRLGWGAYFVGDLNNDGFGDFAGGTFNGLNPLAGIDTGSVAVIYGDGPSLTATASRFSLPGDGPLGDPVPSIDFGPTVRAEVDYSDDNYGDDGLGGAPLTTVTLTRSSSSITGLGDPSMILPVTWEITTDRTDVDDTLITLKYLESELAAATGVVESDLSVYRAPALSGPWVQLGTFIDSDRNEATAITDGFSFFALATVDPPVPIELSLFTVN